MRALLLACSGLLVSGCAMGWVRPNTTRAQTHDDTSYCNTAAYGKYPTKWVRIDSTDATQPSYDEDVNEDSRAEEARSCMLQKGYSKHW
jgi:hypothetical protein